MSKRKCVVCGKDPADGYANVWSAATGKTQWFCHGDDDEVTCYMADRNHKPWDGPRTYLIEPPIRDAEGDQP